MDLVNQKSERSPTEKYVEKVAKIYTPCVILIALAAATIPWSYGREVRTTMAFLFFGHAHCRMSLCAHHLDTDHVSIRARSAREYHFHRSLTHNAHVYHSLME